MAEAEHSDKSTPHRRYHQQNRPPYSNRGRGRLDPHVSKALHNFGVTDLRELLDRKHQDLRQSKSGPPPDPSYSYLKDPLRENTKCDNPSRIHYKDRPERAPDSWSRGHSTNRGSRGRGGGVNRDDKHHQFEASLIQNPINIKVALTTSTGERSCKLDEENKLVDIKYVANHRPQERRSFRREGGGNRGRGSGGRGRGRYESDQERDSGDTRKEFRGRGRYESDQERDSGDTRKEFRGRSRYENDQERDSGDTRKEFRGRGGRQMGHGRERGGYNPRASNRNNHQNADSNPGQKADAAEVPTEDNWDIECSNPSPEQNENLEEKGEENSLNLEKVCTQNTEEYEPEEYYTEDDVHSDIIDKNLLQRETEEDLIITSSVPEKNDGGKRTVKFKVVDKKDNVAQSQQAVDQKDIKSKQKVTPEEGVQKNEKGKVTKTSKRETRERKRKEKPTDERVTKVDEELKPADVSKDESVNESKNT